MSSLCLSISRYCRNLAVVLGLVVSVWGCKGPAVQVASGQDGVTPVLSSKAWISDDGYSLPYTIYEPERGQVRGLMLALHGFNDYSRAFERMCRSMSQAGYLCIAYDQRGFGRTEGVGLWPGSGRLQSDLAVMIELLSQRYPSLPLILVGESMGGAVILSGAARYPELYEEKVAASVLLAPAVWARSTQPWYQRWLLWLAVHTFPSWSPTGEGLEIQATDNIEALREMGRDPYVIKKTRIDAVYGLNNLMDEALEVASQMPVSSLVLYGERDEVIPKEPVCLMLQTDQQLKAERSFIRYQQGFHMLTRDLQAEQVFEDIRDWLQEPGTYLENSSLAINRLCSSS